MNNYRIELTNENTKYQSKLYPGFKKCLKFLLIPLKVITLFNVSFPAKVILKLTLNFLLLFTTGIKILDFKPFIYLRVLLIIVVNFFSFHLDQ